LKRPTERSPSWQSRHTKRRCAPPRNTATAPSCGAYSPTTIWTSCCGCSTACSATSGSDISLKNWYVYSDSGNELFIFGDTTLPAGGNVILGTKSSEDGYDVYWDDKNVISNKKEDIISLYDENGNLIWAD